MQGVKGSGVGHTVAQIQSLAWEHLYATGAAIKKKINILKKKKKKQQRELPSWLSG